MENELVGTPRHPLHTSAGLQALVVTDDEDLATTLGRDLVTLGHAVLPPVPTVEATPRRLMYLHPDILLLDLKFLIAGGAIVLREMQQTYVRPLVLVVHEADVALLRGTSDYGGAGIVILPTSTDQLAVTIIMAVARFLDLAPLRCQVEALHRKLARYRLPRPTSP